MKFSCVAFFQPRTYDDYAVAPPATLAVSSSTSYYGQNIVSGYAGGGFNHAYANYANNGSYGVKDDTFSVQVGNNNPSPSNGVSVKGFNNVSFDYVPASAFAPSTSSPRERRTTAPAPVHDNYSVYVNGGNANAYQHEVVVPNAASSSSATSSSSILGHHHHQQQRHLQHKLSSSSSSSPAGTAGSGGSLATHV